MSSASPLEELELLEVKLPFYAKYELTRVACNRYGEAYAKAIDSLVDAATNLAEADGAWLHIEIAQISDRLISFSWPSATNSDEWEVIPCILDTDTVKILDGFMTLLRVETLDDVILWMLEYALDLQRALDLDCEVTIIYPDGTHEVIARGV